MFLKKAEAILRDNQYSRIFVGKITGSSSDKVIDVREIVKTTKHDNSERIISTRLMLSN